MRSGGEHRFLFEFYRALIRLRQEIPALADLSKKGLKVRAFPREKILLWERKCAEDRVLGIFNFSGEAAECSLPAGGPWMRILVSANPEWGGPGSPAPENIPSGSGVFSLTLNGHSLVLYRRC